MIMNIADGPSRGRLAEDGSLGNRSEFDLDGLVEQAFKSWGSTEPA